MQSFISPSKKFFVYSLFLISFFQAYAQPNFVVILADDQGWTGSSVQMDPNISESKSDYFVTSELQALAEAGMTFSQAYAPAPKCSPSRCAILTGRTTARNHFTTTGNAATTDKILIQPLTNTQFEGTDTTLAEWLKSINMDYTTAHFGKWHLGNNTSSPSDNGFDFNDGNTSNGDGDSGGTVQVDPKKIFDLTDRSVSFIQDAVDDGKPFFLQLSHYAVHTTIEAKQETIDLYNDPTQRPLGTNHNEPEYAAMTEDMDTGIGQLLAAISNMGIDDNTYIIFMSDNGGPANVTTNTPLRRAKTFIYEGGIRVPFIIKGPNIAANSYNPEPIAGYDLFQTIAALTESPVALPSNQDGQSIVPLLTGNTFTRTKPLFFHSPHYDNNPNKTPRTAIVSGNIKLIVEYETGNHFLYDLSTDIEEDIDLSTSQPSLALDMLFQLKNYLKEVDASMPSLDPNHVMFSGTAPDVDGDGLDDEWEFRELLSYTYGPNDDPDMDGSNNLAEYNNDTDPLFNDPTLALNEAASFEVSPTLAGKVKLAWASMENGVPNYLEIERGVNTRDWETIGKVTGDSSQFIDQSPLKGLAYYRLKIVNTVGDIDYSEIKSIVINAEEFIKIFPNPIGKTLHLEFKNPDPLPTHFELKIVDSNGRLIKNFLKEKTNLISCPVSDLDAGVYFLQIDLGQYSTKIPALRFVIQK